MNENPAAACRGLSDDELQRFLRNHDPVWERLPQRWEDAAFIGNGLTGALLFFDLEHHRIRWLISRSDVGKLDYPGGGRDPIRVQLGTLDQCFPAGVTITGGTLRLDLWNAEIRATVTTNKGALDVRAFAPCDAASLRVELTCADPALSWTWKSGLLPEGTLLEVDDRCVFVAEDFVAHPRTEIRSGGFAVVWGERDRAPGVRSFTCSIGSTPVNRRLWKDNDTGCPAREEAERDFEATGARALAELLGPHRGGWHAFYRTSFFSFSNRELESLYWIQLYKWRSTTRPDRPMIDNHGVWSAEPAYGFSTWDFNVQATYRLHLTANLQAYGAPFLRFMDRSFNRKTMWDAEHGEYRAGMRQQNFLRYQFFDRAHWEHEPELPCEGPAKFLWGVHNVVMHYRHSRDGRMVPRFMLMLEAGLNAMLAGMRVESDGLWHIPYGRSWESWRGKDVTGLLAIMNWALETALEFADVAGVPPEKAARWREIRARMVPYPRNADGYLLGEGQPPLPHRHWTHLMMLYPLDISDLRDAAEVARLRKSIDLWAGISAGLDGTPPQAGFACAAAVALYAYLNTAERAADPEVIARLADVFLYQKTERGPCVWSSTLYREAGPVIETPIFMASALQECYLQSRRDGLHVFPAVPAAWPDAVFWNWHAEGDVLISARRCAGQTQWIVLRSLSGGSLRLHAGMDLSCVYWDGGRERPAGCRSVEPGAVDVTLEKGGCLMLSKTAHPDLTVAPVERPFGAVNSFGLNRRFAARRAYLAR